MGLHAISKGPYNSKKHPQHKIWPHLLRNLSITPLNHFWCSDITFILVKNGLLYLVDVMDLATRKVLSWRLSNTLNASFCVKALDEAITKYGNTEIKMLLDGRGRYLDNIFHRAALAIPEAGGCVFV